MTYNQANELFFCSDCKHHLPTRESIDKVMCAVTLEFRDKENIASCDYAERMDADDRAALRNN